MLVSSNSKIKYISSITLGETVNTLQIVYLKLLPILFNVNFIY
jgi:hypothetical protein